MLQQPPGDQTDYAQSGSARIGDVAAMLRVMRPLNGALSDPVVRRRRLLADLCRLVGVSIGSVPAPAEAQPVPVAIEATAAASLQTSQDDGELSPRLEQTLRHLLSGASEKEVAKKLNLSRHTVHVYVKALYRRYRVSTRAELLARHMKR
jgi:DNA-binding CsgD family transcriptional regulator